MAHLEGVAGADIPIQAVFKDSAGTVTNPDSDPTVKIYNAHLKLLVEQTLTAATYRTSTGTYVYHFVPALTGPDAVLQWHDEEVNLFALITGTVDGVTSVGGNHTITIKRSE